MVCNVIARNCDDHTKNFAFRLKQNESWELTPAYDICFAYRPESTWVSQHNLSINGKRKDITKDDVLLVAKSMNIKKANQIIQQINEAVGNWTTFAAEANVKNEFIEQISKSHLVL